MNKKDVTNMTITGLAVLTVAPILVGAVVNSAGKCYSRITNGIRKIKKTQNKKNLKVEA